MQKMYMSCSTITAGAIIIREMQFCVRINRDSVIAFMDERSNIAKHSRVTWSKDEILTAAVLHVSLVGIEFITQCKVKITRIMGHILIVKKHVGLYRLFASHVTGQYGLQVLCHQPFVHGG